MKKLIYLNLKITALLFCIPFVLSSQNIVIDSTFTSDTEIFPFTPGQIIHGLKVSGSVLLNSDTSLVRLVLLDTNYDELMLYEAYPMITNSYNFNFYNESDETCYLDSVSAYSLEIQLIDAEINIESLNITTIPIQGATNMQKSYKDLLEIQKATQIGTYIEANDMYWFADTNSISQLPYSKKKKLVGEKYNLLGLDFYRGGLYNRTLENCGEQFSNTEIISDWDWRDRHGATDPSKSEFYYQDLNGWMTPVRDQVAEGDPYGCTGLCYLYSNLGATEGLSNIYFAEHKDYILSIQQFLECWAQDKYDEPCEGGGTVDAANYIKNHGIVDDNCYQRRQMTSCVAGPVYPNGEASCQITINGSVSASKNLNTIRQRLLDFGPGVATIIPYNGSGNGHAMALVGYGTADVGDEYCPMPHGVNPCKTIPEDFSCKGYPYWIFKNSWGTNWGIDGYMYHMANDAQPWVFFQKTPIDDLLTENDIRECYDKDKDGYYNWMLGEKPSSCPENAEKDYDDSNPRIGPFDDNYYGVAVAPSMVVTDDNLQTVNQYAYYNFYDSGLQQDDQIVLNFTIHNYGNAQLNLMDNTFGGTYILEQEGDNYEIDATGFDNIIQKNGSTNFSVVFTLKSQISETKIAKLTIVNNESDIENYVFYLAFADCNMVGQPEHITSDTYWDKMQVIDHNVYVSNGALLNITSDIGFTHNANLYIESGKFDNSGNRTEPAGKVYVDGGNLSALCDNWPGVDVWGISEIELSNGEKQKIDQYTSGNQGSIKLMNGGKISYAQNAIETIKYDSRGNAEPNTTGGIAIINDGEIYNCTNGVILYPFENHHPVTGEIMSNASYFKRAHFYNDKNIVGENQLVLDEVDGISIKGCTFENQNNATGGFIPPSYGLNSYNSSFKVGNYEPIVGDTIQTNFIKHDYGIYANSSGRYLTEIISINSTYFDNNKTGIYMSAIDKPQITRNEFLIKDKYSKFSIERDTSFGIYLDDATTAYVIEENNLYSTLLHSTLVDDKCVGIVTKNNGTEYNELYNNNITNLTIGIEAIGENRAESGEGLCIKCNDFQKCLADIYVVPNKDGNGNPITGTTIGIAEEQGSLNSQGGSDPTLAAGNTFSYDNTFQFNNDDNCEFVEYNHHNRFQTEKVWPERSNNINANNDLQAYYSKEVSCPSNFGSGINTMTQSIKMATAIYGIDSYTDTLEMQTDGGNTTALNLDVNTSIPIESLELRQQLIDESPYLSDTVMKSAIEKEDVLANAMLRDVLTANPQSAKSQDILQQIYERSNPMPSYMMDEILEGKDTIGAKEVLERKLARNKTLYDMSFNKLERYYIADTLGSSSNDSLLSLWNNSIFASRRYKAAFYYLEKGDSSALYNSLDNVVSELDLSQKEGEIHEQYENLFDILWAMKNDTTAADSVYVPDLMDIASGNSIPSAYARNILISTGEFVYIEPVYFPECCKKADANINWNNYVSNENLLKVFPNPTTDYFIVEYNLITVIGKSEIEIFDLFGRSYDIFKVDNTHSQKVIPIVDYKAGIYFIRLNIDGMEKESKKLIVTK